MNKINVFKAGTKKIMIMTIALLVIGAVLMPSIGAFYTPKNSKLNYVNTTKNENNIENLESESQIVNLKAVKWCKNGVLKPVNLQWTKGKYVEFIEKMNNVDTSEDAFEILKEYDLIPEEKTLQNLKELIKFNTIVLKPLLKSGLKGLINGCEPCSDQSCSGELCLVNGHIDPPIVNFHIPTVFYELESYFGGYVKVVCGGQTCIVDVTEYILMDIIGWIGIFVPYLIQWLCPYTINFVGLALLIDVYGY